MKNKLTNHIKTKIGKWQVLYSPSKNFLWIKNAKVAGTSMYRGPLSEIKDLLAYKKNSEEFDKWWDSLTDIKLKSYFIFTFVRNPLDRCVSAFSHIIVEEAFQRHHDIWHIISPGEKYGNDELTFDELYRLFIVFTMRLLKSYNINDDSIHWMPQSILTECDGETFVDYIGKYETLTEDWKFIANKLDINTNLANIPISQTTKNAGGGTREVLQGLNWRAYFMDLDIIQLVSDYYGRDIFLFGYGDTVTELAKLRYSQVGKTSSGANNG